MSVSYVSDSLRYAVVLHRKVKGIHAENVYKVCRILPRKSEGHWPAEKKTYPFEAEAIARCNELEQ